MSKLEPLKPCPFCGSDAGMVIYPMGKNPDGELAYKVVTGCTECSAEITIWASTSRRMREIAAAAWNRRAE